MRGRTLFAWLLVGVALGATSPVAAATDATYRLGAGDVVEVQVWREPDLSGRFTIDAKGDLPHVLAGAIPAAGETLETLRARVKQRLERDYLREARVGVSLVESARRKASVLGAVEEPGLYALGNRTRVLELIFAAGGITDDAGTEVTLLRFDDPGPGEDPARFDRENARVRIQIDLGAILDRGDLSRNPTVTPGDVVVVAKRAAGVSSAPPTEGWVRVVGEVEKPGRYAIEEAPTVLDALLLAGGLTDYASGNRAHIVRSSGEKRSEVGVRLSDLLRGKAEAKNLPLEPGDLVVVPESFF